MLGRFQRDYYGGVLMMVIGLGAAYLGHGYGMGSLSQMGPGFFPTAIGVLVAAMGVLVAAGARNEVAEEAWAHAPEWRGWCCITLSLVAFVLMAQFGGLLPATFAIVFVSALGDRSNTVLAAVTLAAAMCLVCVIVFWWALRLQLPLLAWDG